LLIEGAFFSWVSLFEFKYKIKHMRDPHGKMQEHFPMGIFYYQMVMLWSSSG